MATIGLPVETKARELYGKLWLSLNLIERGHHVVFGPSYEVKRTLYRTQPDIYITKTPRDTEISFFKKLQNAGVKICGLDTEGAVYASMDDFAENSLLHVRNSGRGA